MNELAVVIPAYKATFFRNALHSLAMQTNKRFTVYVGDDHSPEDLKSICDDFSEKLTIYYKCFDTNIGGKNLVRQWERCIALSAGEEWIWLFSDDDIAEPNCVDAFFQTKAKSNNYFDVYRFNTVVIDAQNKICKTMPQGPIVEDSVSMAYNLLLGKRGNSMPDHIFSRRMYEKKGFVHTDFAQGADWATSILHAQEKGMRIVEGAEVRWRLSHLNISGIAAQKKDEMLRGHLQFIRWVLRHFNYLKDKPEAITYDMVRQAAKDNLCSLIIHHYKGLTSSGKITVFAFFVRHFKLGTYRALKLLVLTQKTASAVYPGYPQPKR